MGVASLAMELLEIIFLLGIQNQLIKEGSVALIVDF